jgi:protein TonB
MKKEKFITQPFYEGGNKALEKKVLENMKYPATALEKRVEGTVFLKYDIDHKGTVIAARVITSIGFGCDEEAVRLVKLLRFTVPKQPNGLKVIFHKELYIHFRLPKEQLKTIEEPALVPTPQQTPYTYNYTVSVKKEATKPKIKPKNSYQFVITK